jgi:phage anti-repressor protein
MMQKNGEKLTNQSPIDFDFSHLYDTFNELLTTSNSNPFPVDFDDAWQWVGFTTKGNAFRLLKRKFKQNIDYQVFIFKDKNPQGGRPKEGVCLSIDCFKMFCMLAETELGDNVRLYFLECEKKLHKVLQLVQEAQASQLAQKMERMEARIDALEQQNEKHTRLFAQIRQTLKSLPAEVQGMVDEKWQHHVNVLSDAMQELVFEDMEKQEKRITFLEKVLQDFAGKPSKDVFEIVEFYGLQEGKSQAHKLGISSEIDIRAVNLATGNSKPLHKVLTIEFYSRRLAKSFEDHIHEVFSDNHIHGEWFNLESADLAFIEQVGLMYQAHQRRTLGLLVLPQG